MVFQSISDLQKSSAVMQENPVCRVLGYYKPGDGGGGEFYWDPNSTDIADNGMIFQVTGITAGRWKRLQGGPVSVIYYGAVAYPDDSLDGIDALNAISAAAAFCEASGKDLYFPSGHYYISGTFFLPSGCTVYGDYHGASLKDSIGTVLHAKNSFTAGDIVSCDRSAQFTYRMEGFQILGKNPSNTLVALHIGSCVNSLFKRISIVSTKTNSVLVKPTTAGGRDVENLTLEKIWTLQSGSLTIEASDTIANAGSITDFSIRDCQLSADDTTTDFTLVSAVPLRLISHANHNIFGGRIERVFLQAKNNSLIEVDGNGGGIAGINFTDISNDLWGPLGQSFIGIVDVIAYKISNCKNINFYACTRTPVPGHGYQLTNVKDAVFEAIDFSDYSKYTTPFRNKFVSIAADCERVTFRDVSFSALIGGISQPAFKLNTGATVFSDSINGLFGDKIIDNGLQTEFHTTTVKTICPVINRREKLYAATSGRLVNYPTDPTIFCQIAAGRLSFTFPAGNNSLEIAIPIEVPAPFDPTPLATLSTTYVFQAIDANAIIEMAIYGIYAPVTKKNLFTFYSMALAAARNTSDPNVRIRVSGNRTTATILEFDHFDILENLTVPYRYNNSKTLKQGY